MKLLSIDNYIDFECIGGNCPISCCGGNWGICIDDKSYEYYMSVEGEFGDRLKAGIMTVDDQKLFRLDDKTRDCVFLNENKLCKIYRTLGPDALCETCKTYPRVLYKTGDILFCFLTNSCPEVNRLIMQRKDPIKTLFDDSEEREEESADEMSDTDRSKFNDAIRVLSTGMHVIQNRDIKLSERLFLLLFYVERFQKLEQDKKNASELISVFSKPDIYTLFLGNRKLTDYYAEKIHIFIMVYRVLMYDSYEHPMWTRCTELANDIVDKGVSDIGLIEKVFLHIRCEDFQIELEQLMAYRFFAVFMHGFENIDYMDKLAYEIVMLVALETYIALTEVIQGHVCSQEERILFYSLCGRIDHSSRKKEKLVSELKKEGFYEMDKLVKLVS